MVGIHGTFSPMQALVPLILIAPCLLFWGWMFRDMMQNEDLPREIKENWTFAFIILNVFAAVLYYNAVFRHRR